MTTLLSVDWDFFFPNPNAAGTATMPDLVLFDWGHREAPMFEAAWMWEIRASGFLRADRPLPGTSGEEADFWPRFRFADDATLWLADSHAMAAMPEVINDVETIWHFDAHHDCGYGPADPAGFDCGDWLRAIYDVVTPTVHVRYPRWQPHPHRMQTAPPWADARADDPAEALPVFDRVFLCRSPAWVPTWLDEAFTAFVAACPLPAELVWFAGESVADPRHPRGYAPENAEHFAAQMTTAEEGATR